MTRCDSCNGILTKTDELCYVCGEPVPGASKRRKRVKVAMVTKVKQESRPISALSNLLFLGSLVLTGFCYFSQQRLPLALSLGLTVSLLSMRLLDGRATSKDSSPRWH